MEPRRITLGRYVIHGTILFFSLLVLALSAHILSQTANTFFFIPSFISLDLAVAVITLVVVTVSLVVDFFRKGAFTSFVVTEISWSFLLMVLWIAAAGHITALQAGVPCDLFTTFDEFGNTITDTSAQTTCHEAQAIIAFSWLNWLLFLLWFVSLTTFAAVAHTRGNTAVWTGPVVGTDFYSRKAMPVVTGVAVSSGPVYGQQQQYIGGPMQGGPVQPQYTGVQYPPTTTYSTPSQQEMQV